jgi:hypothetical protein
MNWSEAAVDMVKTWTNAHQKLWAGWLDTMQGIGRAPTPNLRGQIIDTWQKSVDYTLDAQAEWLKVWATNVVRMEGAPESVKEFTSRSHDAMTQWNEAQRELWKNLFDVLQQAGPETTAYSLERDSQDVFRTWQESTRKIMEQQMAWLSGQISNLPQP